jgi:hypothetical protein
MTTRPPISRCMKFPHLVALLALLLLTGGCATSFDPNRYTKLRVTDHHGDLIAEWVAKGYVMPVEKGYRITAVERLSGPRIPVYSRYPEGWRTTVTGPHITQWRCGEPTWLYALNNPDFASTRDMK